MGVLFQTPTSGANKHDMYLHVPPLEHHYDHTTFLLLKRASYAFPVRIALPLDTTQVYPHSKKNSPANPFDFPRGVLLPWSNFSWIQDLILKMVSSYSLRKLLLLGLWRRLRRLRGGIVDEGYRCSSGVHEVLFLLDLWWIGAQLRATYRWSCGYNNCDSTSIHPKPTLCLLWSRNGGGGATGLGEVDVNDGKDEKGRKWADLGVWILWSVVFRGRLYLLVWRHQRNQRQFGPSLGWRSSHEANQK
ncbi:hypothetical protein BDN72DRAFT_573346 [Pluteus cervinus]|uniref:Uncharacterized protein n=1 Tax=Pluteus cervinus TaxID=181527 RepID=A0ACD3AWN9_9AGAR|nr:hypothetical protein BDN72DRAFT_573346 [Pluteus cervinus]